MPASRVFAACLVAAFAGPVVAADEVATESPPHHRSEHRATASKDVQPLDADSANGNASFYSRHLSGRKTASGERYDPEALTAAHRTLPLGTRVKVVNPKNDRSVVVTVNDRGPMHRGRMLDVSSAAADRLGMRKSGVTKVVTEVVGKDDAAH
jgi:rare lipoprotein A